MHRPLFSHLKNSLTLCVDDNLKILLAWFLELVHIAHVLFMYYLLILSSCECYLPMCSKSVRGVSLILAFKMACH
jgi:hypothetical protein